MTRSVVHQWAVAAVWAVCGIASAAAAEHLQVGGEWCFIEAPAGKTPVGAVLLLHGNGETVGADTSTWERNPGTRFLMDRLLATGYLLAQSNAAATPANGMWGNAATQQAVVALMDYLRQKRGVTTFDAIALSAGNATLLNLEISGKARFRHAVLTAPVISLASLYRCPGGFDRVTGISGAFGFSAAKACPGDPEHDPAFLQATENYDPLRSVEKTGHALTALSHTAWMACYEEQDPKVPPPENILKLRDLMAGSKLPMRLWALPGAASHGSKEMFEGCTPEILQFLSTTTSTLKPASIFGDHMVLQRDRPLPVWGTATPGQSVTVSFAGQSATATTDADGKWMVRLKPLAASAAPRVLAISQGQERVELQDVLVGEVWLCSGQSNMELTPPMGLRNPEEEIAKAQWPEIRLNLLSKYVSEAPMEQVQGSWKATTPETMRTFSAAAYFFGREVYQKLKVPIGLIGDYYGGSNAQSWTRREVFEADPELKIYLTEWDSQSRAPVPPRPAPAGPPRPASAGPPRAIPAAMPSLFGQRPNSGRDANSRYRPSNFYNAMIAPLIPFAIRGVIWYQGEANTANARDAGLYAKLFPAMIQDWRTQWGEGDFPFLFVQLPTSEPNYPNPTDSAWARVRESQDKTLALKNTGMVVTLDIGEGEVVHAHNKKAVGERLAALALNKVYGLRAVETRYPRFSKLEIRGNKAILHFEDVASALELKGAEGVRSFAIAGSDKSFIWAQAVVRGKTVEVSSPDVQTPVAVRYAWADNPNATLFSKEGLPVAPFRTDDWPAVQITNPRASP